MHTAVSMYILYFIGIHEEDKGNKLWNMLQKHKVLTFEVDQVKKTDTLLQRQ